MYNNNYIILNIVVYFQQYLFPIHEYKFMQYKYSDLQYSLNFQLLVIKKSRLGSELQK